jgi:hypothetical protein
MTTVFEEKDAIRELGARYCFLIDGARYDEWANLFAEDGQFAVAGMFEHAGRTAIRSFTASIPLDAKGRPGFKHCVLNQIIDVDGDSASGECYFLLLRDGKPLSVDIAGRYVDRLVKRGGRWLFASRTAHFDYPSR